MRRVGSLQRVNPSRKFKFAVGVRNNSDLFRQAILSSDRASNWEEVEREGFYNWLWTPVGVKKYFPRNNQRQTINHFSSFREICTKDRLFQHLRRFGRMSNRPLSFIPKTFHFTGKRSQGVTEFQDFANNAPESTKWIVKPCRSNCGKGITVHNSVSEVLSSLDTAPNWIVQEYISDALLIQSHKFDIRLWVICTDYGEFKVFLYNEGYLRMSSLPYDDNSLDPAVHLTNHCFQQHLEEFGQVFEGNTLMYSRFHEFIGQENFDKVHSQVCSIIKTVFRMGSKLINKEKLPNVFELFGFDFMVTNDMSVKLIEINTNPLLAAKADSIKDILPDFAEHVLRASMDVMFPPEMYGVEIPKETPNFTCIATSPTTQR
ncbi:hypothetical protein PCE1_003039 [Barthelona sp. PCE]